MYYLTAPPQELVQRSLAKYAALDYWESGMDLGLDRDMFASFLEFQSRMQQQFRELEKTYAFEFVDANRAVDEITEDLKLRIGAVLARK